MKNSKISTSILFSLVVLTLVVIGCSKDRIEQKSLKEYNPPNDYLDSKKQEEQEFVIDSAGTEPLKGNQGTTVAGGKNCLMLPNGDTVAYPFVVKLVELYTPKDMIYWQMPTIASDTILETAGEIRLRAFKDGTELALRPGCDFLITMPNAAPKNYMRVFYGFTATPFVDWTDSPASLGVTTSVNPVFTANSTNYLAQIARLGWINCGFKKGSNSNSKLSFISSTDNLTGVAIFIYFPDTKTVMQVNNLTSGSIPNGSSVKIIAIAVDGAGKLYSFSKSQTVTSSDKIEVTMAETTDAALTSALDGL